ncbi:diacylglycerol kinase [Christiangramia salexigens]|uniref:Diacylglycerol kinase n=1 Tax=Christiangramia salexigens TaxID=1913577 RepID=A0A1L3J402_9FLAO|nr:diacylglycerol kinase [Christiangramia salexigens]
MERNEEKKNSVFIATSLDGYISDKNGGIDWPYDKPVFVLSNKLSEIPESLQGKAFLIKGNLIDILNKIHEKGYYRLYIDGGTTIRNFLKEDLIDEMTLTTIPILLGGGTSLFSELPNEMKFELIGTKTYLNQIIQNHYKRQK